MIITPKRGDIFYVEISNATGHEMCKNRPGIIVSCDELNATNPCVIVVLCSTQSGRDLPEHVTIRTMPRTGKALCEHICTVDKSRLGSYLGRVTDQELEQIDIAIMAGLSLDYGALQGAQTASADHGEAEERDAGQNTATQTPTEQPLDLVRAEAERDVCMALYEKLLDRMMGSVNA